jgi:ATP-dependent protease ClpP protease subunit
MKKQGVFLQAMAADATEARIDIVGVIGWEVAFTELKRMFAGLGETVKRVVFEIYSPGGDVWDGNGIVQAIGELGKTRETVARVQVAASMATLIAVACQKRSMASNGRFLVHNAWTTVQGDAEYLEKRAKELRDCEQEAAKFYSDRTGQTVEAMLALMNEERWMTPEETKQLGFVQEIDDPFNPEDVAAVKAEIVAAGKWPVALAEIETTKQENGDGNAGTGGSEGEGERSKGGNNGTGGADDGSAGEQVHSPQPGVEQLQARYEAGRSEALMEYAALIDDLKGKLVKAEAIAARYQGERDKALAKIAADASAHAVEVKTLTEKLATVNDRLKKLLDGALSFSPNPESWEEAMRLCGGDYQNAAKLYPELRQAFNRSKTTK